MNKPNPEEFGRQILWHLCGLRADLRVVMQMMSRQAEPDISKADEICRKWTEGALKIQRAHYEQALKKAGIPPSQDSESNED